MWANIHGIWPYQILTSLSIGATLPSPTMLWPHISTVVIEWARVGGADAHCASINTHFGTVANCICDGPTSFRQWKNAWMKCSSTEGPSALVTFTLCVDDSMMASPGFLQSIFVYLIFRCWYLTFSTNWPCFKSIPCVKTANSMVWMERYQRARVLWWRI